jgi:tetratricopeptide (TPR) repeat protein
MTLESGQVLAERYALLRRLGDGRDAEVWLARDRESRSDCVLKILRSGLQDVADARRRFLHGAGLQRAIEHPNVLRCIEIHDGAEVFAVFAGDAVADVTRLRGAEASRIVPVLECVAAGLAAVHAQGIVHGDVKCANVLLAHDGRPMLTDFDLAARLGEATGPRGGSPFSASPQQLAGADPAVADDVYAFGALACELLSGYPPFYPDALAAAQATIPPTLAPARSAVSAGLEQLMLRCLAREASARPADMNEVRGELLALRSPATEVAPAPRPVAPAVALRIPQAPSPAIEPEWRRPASSGPSERELRSQGFRRGLLAAAFASLLLLGGIVILVLPGWVERREASTAAPPKPAAELKTAPAAPASAEPDLQRLASIKRQVDELRPAVAQRLAALEQRTAGAWAGETFARGKQALADADAAADRRDYDAALALLKGADRDLRTVEQSVAGRLREALAAGSSALAAGDGDSARRQFELALQIEPANAVAKRALQRVASLGEVRKLLAEAAELERTGQAAAAQAAYRKALQIDGDTVEARDALVRLEGEATGRAFGAAVAEALAAASRKDYAGARAAYERAARIRPGANEVREGLEQIERALGDRSITAHLDAAARAEREERWSDALTEYRAALKVDPNLLAAQQGVERAEPRAMLDAELDAYLEKPEKVFASDVRGAARATIARAAAVPDPGPVLVRKSRDLQQLVAAAETPVRIAIASDNQTDVTIYRVGRLGTFEHKDMELLPGRYTVVGTRSGFRDVRRELTLVPGREPPAVVIRCEERI